MNVRIEQPTASFAANEAGARLQPFTIKRRSVGTRDVQIEIDYCGVCHSDIHMVKNDWGMSAYPMVPGHETFNDRAQFGRT